ncbi:MAG: CopD family protein [Acetobacteraceae bacterium]
MTIDALLPFYRLTLALHVISVILWMAGMLTLPWLYVEHARLSRRGTDGACLCDIERRLMKLAINPTMIAAWLFGVLLVLTPGAMSWSLGWWWTKLTAVVLMSAFHGALSQWRRAFRDGRNARTEVFYRIAAGIPVTLVVIIVVMVVTQPF